MNHMIGKVDVKIKLFDGRHIEMDGRLMELNYNMDGVDIVSLEMLAYNFKITKED